jgi:hypothetical protein
MIEEKTLREILMFTARVYNLIKYVSTKSRICIPLHQPRKKPCQLREPGQLVLKRNGARTIGSEFLWDK